MIKLGRKKLKIAVKKLRKAKRAVLAMKRKTAKHGKKIIRSFKAVKNGKIFSAAQTGLKKFSAAALALGLLLQAGGLFIPATQAYFNDTEISAQNSFAAGSLDFKLVNNEQLVSVIGAEAGGEITRVLTAMPEDGSMPMDYAGGFKAGGAVVDPLCQKLTMEAKRNGLPFYSGPLADFAVATSTEFGSWELRFDLPPTASAAQGDKCQGEVKFWAWPQGQIFTGNGFFDEESLPMDFTARMVVLNEIFARPATGAPAPKDREYVELYNNGNASVDVLGWNISEMAGATEMPHTIVAAGATSNQMQPFGTASTTIASHGLLLLQFGGTTSHFNDTGDTIKLYGGANQFLDGHTYPFTAIGKAHVRFPDGIGYWVDPEPTPGELNIVTLEDLRAAGFDETTIADIMALVKLVGKNADFVEQQPAVLNEPKLCSTSEADSAAICVAGPIGQAEGVEQILQPESQVDGATITLESTTIPESLAATTLDSITDNFSGAASETVNTESIITPPAEQPPKDADQNPEQLVQNPPAVLPNQDQTPAIEPQVLSPMPEDPKPTDLQTIQAPPAVEPSAEVIPTEPAVTPEAGGGNE
jgi:hypothetical protein